MRTHIATLLIRFALKILSGHDDRCVFVNTQRRRSQVDGRIYPFLGYGGERRAFAVPRDDTTRLPGMRMPAIVARLVGWDLYGLGQ